MTSTSEITLQAAIAHLSALLPAGVDLEMTVRAAGVVVRAKVTTEAAAPAAPIEADNPIDFHKRELQVREIPFIRTPEQAAEAAQRDLRPSDFIRAQEASAPAPAAAKPKPAPPIHPAPVPALSAKQIEQQEAAARDARIAAQRAAREERGPTTKAKPDRCGVAHAIAKPARDRRILSGAEELRRMEMVREVIAQRGRMTVTEVARKLDVQPALLHNTVKAASFGRFGPDLQRQLSGQQAINVPGRPIEKRPAGAFADDERRRLLFLYLNGDEAQPEFTDAHGIHLGSFKRWMLYARRGLYGIDLKRGFEGKFPAKQKVA